MLGGLPDEFTRADPNLWNWSRPFYCGLYGIYRLLMLSVLSKYFLPGWDILYRLLMLQDPKSSLWLWKKHEKKKQKKRTVNYQSYMDKMRLGGGDEGFDSMGHMTKNYMHKIENFLTYGQWNLDRRQIEKLKKEEERKERVGRKTFPIWKIFDKSLCPDYTGDHRQSSRGVVDTSEKSRPRQLSGIKK